jgi:hypothetical protein
MHNRIGFVLDSFRFQSADDGRDAAVGRLTYGSSGQTIEIDDRALAHVQIVIGSKLRRKESLFFSWREGADTGGGRGSIWLDSSIELHFKYASAQRIEINRKWLEQLVLSANTATGLQMTDEPIGEPPPPPAREMLVEERRDDIPATLAVALG